MSTVTTGLSLELSLATLLLHVLPTYVLMEPVAPMHPTRLTDVLPPKVFSVRTILSLLHDQPIL